MNLSELKNGEKGVIVKVRGHGAFRKRITEMGFVKGKEIEVIKKAPLLDPIEYSILGYHVTLRASEAVLVEIVSFKEAKNYHFDNEYKGVVNGSFIKEKALERRKVINVALVGNPNSGKTTIFNIASGSSEHVGNYSGVTVDAKNAVFKHNGYTFNLIDLPGTYSLSAYSPEELYVRKYIFGEAPDVILNIIDASNIDRNLFLTTQLIDMDQRVVVALNMFDELDKKGDVFNYSALGKMLGIPFVPTVGSKGKGISNLFDKIIDVYENKEPIVRHIHINYGKAVENAIKDIQEKVKQNKALIDIISPRYIAIKLLEKDESTKFTISKLKNRKEIEKVVRKHISVIHKIMKEDSETVITDAKYGFIAGALKETYVEGAIKRRRKTEIVDTIITHKLFGFPIFLLFMFSMFYATFQFGHYPMSWIESFVGFISSQVQNLMTDGPLKDLIVDGIIGGVGGVIVFLPNILILFLFISFMEDTGYMSRAAFIMDKLMHKIGLHGRSFIPLIMGFGCNVPAIMATRTIENRNDRFLTILINPLMSCSARLPVYILIIAAFFPENPSTMLFLVYMIGIGIAILMAKLFKRTLFAAEETPFVMELPPYRIPTIKVTIRHMWDKGYQYLKKMGGIILIGSIIVWALGYFPRTVDYSMDYDSAIDAKTDKIVYLEKSDNKSSVSQNNIVTLNREISKLKLSKAQEHQEYSYIGQLGKFIEPIMSPLGFDWKISVSLLAGITAKEIVISTLGVLYQVDPDDDTSAESLQQRIINEEYVSGVKKGQKVFSPLVAFGFLMFTLIYFPCIAVIIAIKKETEGWKWALFTIFYTTSLAWIVAFLVNKIGSLLL